MGRRRACCRSGIRRFEPREDLTSEWFVGGRFEQRGEVLRAYLVEAALQLLFLAPVVDLLLKVAAPRRAISRGLVDRDRLGQTTRAVVQVAEPLRRLQMIRIERERALEAALRHTILPEHERGDAGSGAKTRVAWPYHRCPGECLERVGEPPMLDGDVPARASAIGSCAAHG